MLRWGLGWDPPFLLQHHSQISLQSKNQHSLGRLKQARINFHWLKAGKENTKIFLVDVFTQRAWVKFFLLSTFIQLLNVSWNSICLKTLEATYLKRQNYIFSYCKLKKTNIFVLTSTNTQDFSKMWLTNLTKYTLYHFSVWSLWGLSQ